MRNARQRERGIRSWPMHVVRDLGIRAVIDEVVDFVRDWALKTELTEAKFIRWIGVTLLTSTWRAPSRAIPRRATAHHLRQRTQFIARDGIALSVRGRP